MTAAERLSAQMAFLVESEKLKAVLRKTRPVGVERRENSAEHSWTLALMVMVLAEHAGEPLDTLRVLKMLLVHDLVEIDAGDTFCYDATATLSKAEREHAAAGRIFGLLPPDQAAEFLGLWQEFEAQATPEATFANAVDRLMPIIQNARNDGGSWVEFGVASGQVLHRAEPIGKASGILGEFTARLIAGAKEQGFFTDKLGV